jgi:hypothetical protein
MQCNKGYCLSVLDPAPADQAIGIVGLKEVQTSKSLFVKCIWAFLLALGLAGTAIVLFKTAEEYSSNPTATSVSLTDSCTTCSPCSLYTLANPRASSLFTLAHSRASLILHSCTFWTHINTNWTLAALFR